MNLLLIKRNDRISLLSNIFRKHNYTAMGFCYEDLIAGKKKCIFFNVTSWGKLYIYHLDELIKDRTIEWIGLRRLTDNLNADDILIELMQMIEMYNKVSVGKEEWIRSIRSEEEIFPSGIHLVNSITKGNDIFGRIEEVSLKGIERESIIPSLDESEYIDILIQSIIDGSLSVHNQREDSSTVDICEDLFKLLSMHHIQSEEIDRLSTRYRKVVPPRIGDFSFKYTEEDRIIIVQSKEGGGFDQSLHQVINHLKWITERLEKGDGTATIDLKLLVQFVNGISKQIGEDEIKEIDGNKSFPAVIVIGDREKISIRMRGGKKILLTTNGFDLSPFSVEELKEILIVLDGFHHTDISIEDFKSTITDRIARLNQI